MSSKPAASKAAPKASAKAAPKAAAKAAPKAAAKAEAKEAPAARDVEVVPKANDIAEAPAADGDAAGQAAKKSRVQLSSVLDISISQARCATHLKQNLGDDQIDEEIKELRGQMKAAKAAGDADKAKELKDKIAELSKNIVRLSQDTPIAAAVVMDNLVKELLRHGMDMAIVSERKIVDVSHLHDGAVTSLLYYPIFNKLPNHVNYNPDDEEELRKQRAAENKAAKEAREAKKEKAAGEKKAPAAKPKAAAKAADEEEDDEEEHAEHTKTTFFTYVENALKVIKKDEAYRSMRVSNRVREYLSDLVTEALTRLSVLSRIVVQKVVDVRTMNAGHIKAVVHLLMADEGRTDEQIAEVEKQIDEKLDVYHGHVKSEKDKKAASLSEGKKAEMERKKLEADLAKKKRQAELALKRSQEASAKAESLTAETAALEPIVAANQAAAKAEVAAE